MANQVTPQPFVPGFGLVDGTVLNSALALPAISSQNAVTASTTQTRLGGTAITAGMTNVSVANASDAVTLGGVGAVVKAGTIYWIKNTSGQTIKVYPPGASDTIDGGAAGANVTLTTASIGFYMAVANVGGVVTWESGKMAVSS